MSVALTVLLIAFCVQGLVKFAVGFLVPYRTRINRIASYCRRDGRIISIYDSVTLAVIVALVALLFLTDMHAVSVITGLIAGMLLIQISLNASTESPTGTRAAGITTAATQTHVVRDPGRPRPGLARDQFHDGTVCLGPLPTYRQAHRLAPAATVAQTSAPAKLRRQ